MMLTESEKIESKQQYTPDIRKTVVAFANTGGGVIYIGVTDEGKIVPLSDIDGVLLKVTGSIRDGILRLADRSR
jgi:ATP-dependent DNA helicase RecG